MSSSREAKALLARGRHAEAGRVFEELGEIRRALDAYTQGHLWRDAGRVCERDGRLDRAVHYYRQARAPADAGRALARLDRHAEAAQAYAEAGEYAQAADQWEQEIRSIQQRGGHEAAQRKAFRMAGACHLRAGDARKAAHMLQEAGEPLQAAQALIKAGLHTEAAALYLSLDMRREAVDALMRAEQPLEAAQLCEKIGESLLAGRLYRQGRDFAAALRCFEKARRWAEAAEAAREIGDWDKVGSMFARAGEYLDSARAYLRAESPDDAIKSLCYLKYTDPRYMDAVRLTVDALEMKADVSFNAERFLGEFLYRDLDADNAELLYRLAQVYEQGEFWETAQEHYERLLAFDPRYRDVDRRLRKMIAYQKDSAAVYKKVLQEDFGYEETTRRMQDRHRAPALDMDGDLEAFDDGLLAGGGAPARPAPPVDLRTSSATVAGPPAGPGGVAGEDTGATRVDGAPVAPAPRSAGGDATVRDASTQPAVAQAGSIVQLEPGGRLGERYELVRRIGTGGRGAVFKAMDLELDEPVAIKVIHPTDVTEQSLAWFRQEIKLARRLTHPNIIRLHDIAEAGGLRFITMELLQGHDLEDVIAEAGGQLPFPMGIGFTRQICSGLGAAHALGVIHRDIKPSNVMVVEGGVVKILDFGIAKLMDVKGLSRTGLAYGTPLYMSPEQIRGSKDLDTRTDLYSLGCVMFQMFTGELPFDAEESFELMLAHINQAPPSPREFRADMPPELEHIILQLLEKDPDDRFQSCEALDAALARLE